MLGRAFKAADFNKDGFVTRHEFVGLIDFIEFFGNLWEKFEDLDEDSNGQVNQDEFTASFGKLEPELVASLTKQLEAA